MIRLSAVYYSYQYSRQRVGAEGKMAEVESSPQQAPSSVLTTDIIYEEPEQDPYKNAISYLEKHNILQIFQAMTARIIYKKPDNPLDFLIDEIGEMKKNRNTDKAQTK